MKKLLGISVVAMLAVTPMMASAGNSVAQMGMAGFNQQNEFIVSDNIATTSYVQGAYNAVATQVNNIKSDINVDKTGAKNLTDTTIGGNVKELDTAMGDVDTLGTGAPAGSALANYSGDLVGAVKAINGVLNTNNGDEKVAQDGAYVRVAKKVGENLTALDDAIGQINTDTGNGGSTPKNIAVIGTGTNQKTVAGNLQALDNAVGKIADDYTVHYINKGAAVAQNLQALDTQVDANKTALDTLKDPNGGDGSIKKSIKTEAGNADFIAANGSSLSNGTISSAIEEVNQKIDDANTASALAAGNYYTQGANVKTAIAAVDSQVKTNENAITKLNGSYVPLYGNWTTGAVTGSVKLGDLGQTDPAL